MGARLVILLSLLALVPASFAQKSSVRRPHGPLNVPCENCHTATSWRPIRAVPEFDHNKTNYPLRGLHEKVKCVECHVKPIFTDVGKNCADCHADIHLRKFGQDCAQCHTVQGWNVSVNQIKDHQNRFPLLGAHSAVQCDACHKSAAVGQFLGLSTVCSTCHLNDYQNTTNPNHAKYHFPTTCDSCHSFDSWQNAKFDHSKTGFLLTQGHANVACISCHINNNYNLQIAPTDCGNSGCHLTTWQKTNNPTHASAGPLFAAANCTNCHTTAGWQIASFDHSTTGFLLTQGHANVACTLCHINNNYNLKTAPNDCGNSGCHLTTWQGTTMPVHSTSGPTFAAANCANCHTTAGWSGANFDHSVTGFTLVGTHMAPTPTPCASCHINNNYTLNSTDCYGCHASSFNATATIGGNVPNHITAGFPTTAAACASCHTVTKWADGKFDHTAFGFPLNNSHATVACVLCHVNGNYALKIAPNDCGNSGCHLTTWQGTNNPTHSTSGPAFAVANCSNCHNTVGWGGANFDHSTTGFALVGTHMAPTPTPCLSCHINNNYTLNSADCYGCHAAAFNSTATIGGNVPNHITAGFPTTAAACSTCHTITKWADGKFDHSTTGFPLANSHTTVACALCHINGNYALKIAPTDCGNSGCHLTTWQGTNNPTHSTSGPAFAVANCSNCHNTVGWGGANFDHSTTGFALVGTHIAPTPTPCLSCHINNNYTLNSADCYGCHAAAFNSTASIGGNVPNHITAGFPTTAAACSSCHTITKWADGKFDHAGFGFPLTNSHATVACALCHVNGNYALKIAPTDCGNAGCHLTTWQGTTTPVHSASGPAFAVANCSNCHNTVGWGGANFDHSTTGFALVGTHMAPTPTPCASCHINNNYTLNSADCYGCHAAAFNSTASIGGNVPNHITSGFPTSAAACSTCHTITKWADGKFDHSTTGFPLTGSHANPAKAPCSACHVNNNYSGNLPKDCYSCHTAAWQSTQTLGGAVPNHIAANFSTTCSNCHNTTSWLGANFNHTFWQLPHHSAVCGDCHINQQTYASISCINCHTQPAHDKTSTDSHHRGRSGYSYGPMTCIASGCHTRGSGGG